MKLAEIASSKDLCERLFKEGVLLENIQEEIKNIAPENEKDEIFNIVKIANRVVRFGSDYDEPDFERGELAASVLELTFNLKEVNDVPFMNAAAYLINAGEDEKALKACLKGNERFPDNLEILNKAKFAAELIDDGATLEIIEKKKESLFEKNPDAVGEEMKILVTNWRIDEAKAIFEAYSGTDEMPAPNALAKLFWIYNLSYKDEKTIPTVDKYLEFIKNGREEYVKHTDLAYQASLFFLNNSRWQDSDFVLNAYKSSGAELTPLILNQILSVSIISKDKSKIENAVKEFSAVYDKNQNFFNEVNYTFANVSNCYAVFGDKTKTIDYLKLAKSKLWDISYVKTMEDYKFISSDPEFLSLF